MKKDYSATAASSAAAKFLSTQEEVTTQETEQPKKKRGRPKKTAQNAPEATEPAQVKKTIKKAIESATEADTKPQRKSDRKSAFSVWMDKATADEVKRYSAISDKKMTDIVERALTEYMKHHPLTTEQKERYKQRIQATIDNI